MSNVVTNVVADNFKKTLKKLLLSNVVAIVVADNFFKRHRKAVIAKSYYKFS